MGLYIDHCNRLGLLITRELLGGAANYILAETFTPPPNASLDASVDASPPIVGQHWVARFLKRHPEFRVVKQRVLDKERQEAESYQSVQQYYEKLWRAIDDHGIQPADIWNMDESGFRIGIASDNEFVIIQHGSRLRPLPQPTNRELVSVIEAISGGGTVIPPVIIFKGKQHMSQWYGEVCRLHLDASIDVSDSGYLNDRIRLS